MPERTLYRVGWVYYREDDPHNRRTVSLEVSALPETSQRLVIHQVWLLLSQKGYDLDPTKGTATVIGTEVEDE